MSFGNLTVRTPYQLYSYKQGKVWPSFTISPGFIAPTGGSTIWGTVKPWTPWFGLWVQRPFWMPGGRILRVRFNQNFYFPLQSQKYGATTCAANGFAALPCSVSVGKFAKSMLGMEYSLTKHWVPAWDFYYKYGQASTANNGTSFPISGQGLTSCTAAGGCQRLAIDPALEYNFTGNVGIIFGAEITVSGRNTGSYIAPQIALQMFK
jgi:hypothetical protein